LPKGTEAAISDNGGKFVLSADDDGDRSDIEFVTEAFTDKPESDAALGRMRSLADSMTTAVFLAEAMEPHPSRSQPVPSRDRLQRLWSGEP